MRLGISIPGEANLRRFIEERLMERFKTLTHSELEEALEKAYQEDSERLKQLLLELILSYRLRKMGRLPRKTEAYVV